MGFHGPMNSTPSIWVPTSAASATLVSWHDAQTLASLTLTGGVADAWADRSGNGRTATQTGTRRPTYEAATLNGRPCLAFDNSDDCMDLGGAYAALFAGSDVPIDIWVAMRTGTLTVGQRHIIIGLGNSSAAANPRMYFTCEQGTSIAAMYRSDDVGTSLSSLSAGGTIASNTNYLLRYTLIGGKTSQIVANGVTIKAGAANDLDVGAATYSAAHIGAVNVASLAASTVAWKCGEITVFLGQLDATESTKMQTYSTGRWGF